jgi:hypothetical protein
MRNPILKITKAKWAGGIHQVIEHLPSKHEVLSSYCSITKISTNKKTWRYTCTRLFTQQCWRKDCNHSIILPQDPVNNSRHFHKVVRFPYEKGSISSYCCPVIPGLYWSVCISAVASTPFMRKFINLFDKYVHKCTYLFFIKYLILQF